MNGMAVFMNPVPTSSPSAPSRVRRFPPSSRTSVIPYCGNAWYRGLRSHSPARMTFSLMPYHE